MSIELQAERNDVVKPNLALLYPCEEFVDVFLRGRDRIAARFPCRRSGRAERLRLVPPMAVSSGLLAANWRRSPKQYGLKICHYYRLPGNAVDTSGVLIFCLVPPQKVAEITPFTTACNL